MVRKSEVIESPEVIEKSKVIGKSEAMGKFLMRRLLSVERVLETNVSCKTDRKSEPGLQQFHIHMFIGRASARYEAYRAIGGMIQWGLGDGGIRIW